MTKQQIIDELRESLDKLANAPDSSKTSPLTHRIGELCDMLDQLAGKGE